MIEGLGYEPVLDRVMGAVRATMVNISTSSVTTAIFTLFAFGLLTGGTAFVWTWAVGFGILLLVTLVFAEFGSSMPLASALYQSASRLVGPGSGYFVGWLYAAAQVAIVGAVCFGIAPIVASFFDEVLTTDQQVLWGLAILAICTAINVIGIKVASTVASAGAIAEVIAMIGARGSCCWWSASVTPTPTSSSPVADCRRVRSSCRWHWRRCCSAPGPTRVWR